jgi:hypothetical protein
MRVSEPSERDVAIYRAVRFCGMSHRNAAAKWGVSPSRVGQILAEVESWHRANAAIKAGRNKPREDLWFEYIQYDDRLSMLFEMALGNSEQMEKQKVGEGMTFGYQKDARTLLASMRIAHAQFAAVGAFYMLLAKLPPDEKTTIAPPVGGCAPSGVPAKALVAVSAPSRAVSDDAECVCGDMLPAVPAQQEREIISLCAQVEEPPLLSPTLSRKQRKRLLERKLRER